MGKTLRVNGKKGLERVWSWLSNTFTFSKSPLYLLIIAYTLLVLYFLPLVLLVVSWNSITEVGSPSIWNEIAISISGLYMTPIRETLGTFVMPFVMAYAVSDWTKGGTLTGKTVSLFLVLVFFFLLSLVVAGLIDLSVSDLIRTLDAEDPAKLDQILTSLEELGETYLKETLILIGMLLGVSARQTSNNEGRAYV